MSVDRQCDISIGSLNVRGINNEIKRNSVFKWARKKNFDVVLLQETYSSVEIENAWNNEWGRDIIYAHGSKHSKGTMVMFKPGMDINVIDVCTDRNGRYIILKLQFMSENFTLINIYAPNKELEKKVFFNDVLAMLDTLNIQMDDKIICGGDWNSIFDVTLDKCGGRNNPVNIAPEMTKMIDTFDFIDIWRVQNPETRRFTFRQKNPLVQTRLDYFLVTNEITDMVSSVDIVPSACSDHSSVTIKLNLIPDTQKGRGYWKFNSQYLEDEEFVTRMSEILQNTTNFNNDIEDKRVAWEWIKYEVRKYCIKYGTKRKKQVNINTCNLLKSLHDLEVKLGNDPDINVQVEYEMVKDQLKEIDFNRSKGAIIRSKVK